MRPRRPPSANSILPGPRPFTQNTKLQLLTRQSLRPQLPYLSQPHITRRLSPLDQQVLRLLSTETKSYVKEQTWLAFRWTVIGWTIFFLGSISWLGIQMELEEHKNPTPAEWSFWTKVYMRGARNEREDRDGIGMVIWHDVGLSYLAALKRLSSGEPDGKDVIEQADGEGIVIPDVGKAGPDISAKSWQWRSGYFECLMGCAEAAEHLTDYVEDTTNHRAYPKEVVIGPSNPDPRPPPRWMGEPPLEENCVKAYDAPETFYMRVLTGKGFTTKQRLEAAWKYATWLEKSDLNESAAEMYKWAVDIAKSSVSDPDSIVDSQTFLLKGPNDKSTSTSSTAAPTANILSALTKLGAHTARTGDVATALPILLSVLKAHHAAPMSTNQIKRRRPSPKVEGGSDIDSAVAIITSLFTAPVFPPDPPSGDTPILRESPLPTCEESELMLYIGEILFATSGEVAAGLSWTKQATQIAEANLDASAGKGKLDLTTEEKLQCKECFSAGVSNWETMLLQLASNNVDLQGREGGQNAGWFEWRGWFGGGGGVKGKTLEEARMGVIEAEMQEVQRCKDKIAKEKIDDDIYKHRGAAPSGVWLG